MSDDFEGIPLDLPEDVPAEIQPDGAVTEDYTGEQVANEGGNPAWYDETYPGQITNTAANPGQDAYGLNILNAQQTAQLTRNINPAFINNLVDPGTPRATPTPNAVTTAPAGLKPFVDANGVVFDPVTGISYPVDNTGRQIIPANVASSIDPAAQSRIEAFNRIPFIGGLINSAVDPNAPTVPSVKSAVNRSATPVYTPSPYTETRQTAVDAARLNAQSEVPNQYLTNIDQAEKNIVQGQAYIDKANQSIQTGQENIVKAESIIAQNNTELADEYLPDARRAELEANNAYNTKVITENKENITANQEYITQTQANIQFNNESINANAAAYRDTNGPSNTTVVSNKVDPNVPVTDAVATGVNNPTTSATPVNAQDGQAFGPALPDGNGGFVDATGNPVDANGVPIFPVPRATYPPSAVNDLNVTTTSPAATGAVFGIGPDGEQEAAIATEVGRALAQQQAVNAAQSKTVNNGDWRVRLSLAPNAPYLYNVDATGILAPLAVTDGVIFPYTPRIEMSYKADYESYALTHSNYKGYFYKSSYTDNVGITATFTAQDTAEANYLLAVIHFFRSVTKMFYGQDLNPSAGAPPPLVYLSGLGQYQFAAHPCVVTSFNYNLPADVDYIRARSTNINGTNMLTRRVKQDLPTNPISGAVARLQNLFSSQGISPGAEICRPPPPSLGQNQPTYVPTKMEIMISLLPVQTRSQVTKQFSLRGYANGDLLKGGFW